MPPYLSLPKVLSEMTDRVQKLEKNGLLIAQEQVKSQETSTWKPLSLRLSFLTFVLLATCALIVVLQWLLYTSQTTGGVIFDPSINDLPLSRTFGYLYAPTIIAVVYGLLWTHSMLSPRKVFTEFAR